MSLIASRGYGHSGGTYPSCLAFLATSVIANTNQITITLTAIPTLSGPSADPSQYIVTSTAGRHVDVLAISIVGSSLVLTTTTQTNGAAYSLAIPPVGMVDTNLNPFNGPFDNAFTGYNTPLAILIAYSVDAFVLDIVFNQSVNQAQASNPANYSISPTLAVTAAERITDLNYRLTTSRQTRDVTYTVTATNINPL